MGAKAALSGRCLAAAEAFAESLRERDQIARMPDSRKRHDGEHVDLPCEPAGLSGERLNLLFVCTRNQWRSPTGEQVWRRHPRVNVRSAGTSASARRVVSAEDLAWADVVLVMEDKHKSRLLADHRALLRHKPLHVLDIPDDYRYMDPDLVELLGDPVADLLGLVR
jgi:predicted protein tyrosine phosphatase